MLKDDLIKQKDDLIKQYEEIMIKLAICSAMEIEGKELMKKMEDEGLPESSPKKVKKGLKSLYKAYDKQYMKQNIINNIFSNKKMFSIIFLVCLIPIILFFILKRDSKR